MNYLITFDVEKKRAADVIEAVKAVGEWGELTPTSYLVESAQTIRAIMETLQPMLGPSDSIAVLTVASPWAAYCDATVETLALNMLGEQEEWIPKDWNGANRS